MTRHESRDGSQGTRQERLIPLRVLMLVPYPGILGPLPKVVPVLVDALRRLGCLVETERWSRHSEHESWLGKLVGRSGDLLRVRRHLAGREFDVLFITTAHTWAGLARDLPLVLATGRLCPHRVIQFHGSSPERLLAPGAKLFTWFSLMLVSRCDAVLLLSEQERLQWQAFCPRGRFEVVANPFVAAEPAAREKPSHSDGDAARESTGANLLYVARLMTEKGIFDLVEALDQLRDLPDCHLTVAGTGPAEPDIRRLISQRDLGSRATLCGYLDAAELSRKYAAADIFVLPTYYAEGFPTVILEAMHAGLPIVATRTRGAADRLAEEVNVLFVPPRRPDLLVSAITRLVEDESLRRRMGEANRRKVEDFAPDKVAPDYVEILRSVIAGGATPAVGASAGA